VPLLSGQVAERDVDDIVIGSGFGGSVAAYRLAEAGRRVCVLERGKAYPPGSFPRSPKGMAANLWDPSAGLHGMFDTWSFTGIDAVVASGLGGGSLIYANVLLRKDASWFRQHQPYDEGDEAWPISYEDLEPHYERVEQFLDVQTLPYDVDGFRLGKTAALRDAAATVGGGARWDLAPLAVGFRDRDGLPLLAGPLPETPYPNIHGRPRLTCRLCGECDVGCNDGAKNSLDHTYLSAASACGAAVSVRCEVRRLRRLEDGRFAVDYVVHAPDAEGKQTATTSLPLHTVRASRLFLAAGTLGTTYLLLRNRTSLGLASPALGTRFCGNGDLLGFIFGATRNGAPLALDGATGPVISSYVRYPDWTDSGSAGDFGMYIEDAGYPAFADWLAEATQVSSLARRFAAAARHRVVGKLTGRVRTNVSAEVGRLLGPGRLSSSALPLLGMGRDVPDGTLYLRNPEAVMPELESTWSTATSTRYFEVMQERMRALAQALRGRFDVNPTYLFRRVITVHPVGGCPMAAAPNKGVVDPLGRVYGVPGLFVCDASVLPGPVGPNPSLTIAAFADRLCDALQ
jgi:cholesterol oxidase